MVKHIYPDSVEPACYPNTRTFVNRLDIQNSIELKSVEADFSFIRSLELLQNPDVIDKTFDFTHLKLIHQYLFQDLYAWAGKPRSFDMAKHGDVFTPAAELPQYEQDVFSTTLSFSNQSVRPDRIEVAQQLARCLGLINIYHPFPEGNGRAQRVFISLLARQFKYDIDWKSVPTWEMVETSRCVHQGDYKPLVNLIGRVTVDMMGNP